MNLAALPQPDIFGNYWFGKPGDSSTPAIFTCRGIKEDWNKFYLCLGSEGMLWDSGHLQLFTTPGAALKMLRRKLTRSSEY